MSAPLIGISSRFVPSQSEGAGSAQVHRLAVVEAVAQLVSHAGAVPVFLPLLSELVGAPRQRALAQLTACLDGLLLQGGTDIEPKRYQETPISPAWPGDPLRDAFEFELLEHWLPSGKPVLGICRGHQLLNVALGGTLYQDLPSQRSAHPAHDIPEKYCALEHSVRLLEHSWLASLYGLRQARVNSAHHQAIKMLAPGMQTEALSDDGLIEAFRDPAHRFLVALQWHPEFHVGELLDPTPMMREFVGACG